MAVPPEPISGETAAARLAGLEPAGPQPADHSGTERAYLEAAAVLVSFDPVAIRPVGVPPDAGARAAMLRLCEPGHGPNGSQEWHLAPGVRRRVLARMGTPAAFRRALDANADSRRGPVQKALDDYLTGTPRHLDQQSPQELLATAQVLDLLGDQGTSLAPGLPPAALLRGHLDRAQLLAPLRRLVGEHFRGRADTLAELTAHVLSGPPHSGAGPGTGETRPPYHVAGWPPLLIQGPGGVGKSTVLARFVLTHADTDEPCRLPFAYLDCNRPGMLPHEPLTMLGEAAHQLGVQYPRVAEEAEQVRSSWVARAGAADLSGLGSAVPATPKDHASPGDRLAAVRLHTTPEERQGFCEDFARVARGAAGDRPLLFALDSFEAAQRYGPEAVAEVWRLLEGLQAALPSLRPVVVGRAPVEQPAETLRLGDFDREAAGGYLTALLGPARTADRRLVGRVVDLVGGNPLSLRLAADIVRRHGTKDFQQVVSQHRLLAEIGPEERQAYLYQRVLSHIPDPDVRALARWGLVLRRLTPDVIRHVLAARCGVDVPDDARAAELFAGCAREVSLVTVAPDGALVHDPDVRRLLPPLAADAPREVRDIHEAAVAHYAGRTGAAERAEEVYHRLCLGQPSAVLDERWQPGMESLLSGSLDELPPGSQVYLATRAGVTLPQSVLGQVTFEDWERHAEAQMRRLLDLGRYAEAMALFEGRPAGPVSSRLLVLEASARERVGELTGARTAAGRAIRRSTGEGDLNRVLETTYVQARLAMREGDLVAAAPMLDAAADLADRLDHRLMGIRVALARLRLATPRGSAPPGGGGTPREVEDRLLALVAREPAELVAGDPLLLVELAAAVGARAPYLVWQALRTAGLGGLDAVQRHLLADAFEEWDTASGGGVRAAARRRTGNGGAEHALPRAPGEFWPRWLSETGPREVAAAAGELQAAFPEGSGAVAAALASVYRQWLDDASGPKATGHTGTETGRSGTATT